MSELELKHRAGEVRLVRGGPASVPATVQPQPVLSSRFRLRQRPPPRLRNRTALTPVLTITSPMVGTFYGAPNPDASPFVAVGGMVETGDVVCIIEAMKMMNEIEAEIHGRVRRVLGRERPAGRIWSGPVSP